MQRQQQGLEDPLTNFLKEYEVLFLEPKEEAQPVSVRPCRYPFYQKKEIEEIVRELLEFGVIRSSHSPFSFRLLLVRKVDASWRMCVDYISLNQVTIKDKFPIPVVDELL